MIHGAARGKRLPVPCFGNAEQHAAPSVLGKMHKLEWAQISDDDDLLRARRLRRRP